MDITENGMVASSTSSGNSIVFLTHGGFTRGKASWEMKLEEDTNSQCTCFGVAVKPVRDVNYERSKEMFVYRAYNGYRYSMGVCDSSSGSTKIKKGDHVRCDLDMDAGTLSLTIAGADQGVCFTGLAGMEIWPCVQFYSSGRTVRLIKLEGPLNSASSSSSGVVRGVLFYACNRHVSMLRTGMCCRVIAGCQGAEECG